MFVKIMYAMSNSKKKGGNAKHNPTTAMIIIIALMIKTASFIT